MFGRRNIINKKKQINRTPNLAVKRLQKNKPWIVFCKKQLSVTKGILLNQKILLTVLFLPAISLILFGIIKISESDIARIQNIDVIGTQIIDSHDIIKISNLNGQSIFSANLNQARQNIANINGIEKVTISRKNVNGIEIIISEAQGWGYWQHNEQRVLVDASGKILSFARPAPSNAPTIIDFSIQKNNQKEIKVDQNSVKLVARLESEKRFLKMGLNPISYVFEDKRGLTILLEDAPNIVIGDASNYFYKIATLQELISRLNKATSEINEIDLRFGSNVVIR
ncbi:MAG: cell division protein FtsQ/DivIB [Dehalococcoidia bacterium]